MRIDVVASEMHYLDHMLPIFEALPPEMQGRVHPLRPEPLAPQHGRAAMVAGWSDLARLRCRKIYVEHGSGQGYGGDPMSSWNPGYSSSGGRQHSGVIGYVAPSQSVAGRWLKPSVAVGCPKMDRYMDLEPETTNAICFAWHWDCKASPESSSALPHYQAGLPHLIMDLKRRGFVVFAHAHPRWKDQLDDWFHAAGFDAVLNSDDQVFRQSNLLVMDNSSLMYEFASLGRPVVALNAPWFRRSINHGLRFWSHVPGVQVDDIEDLMDLDWVAEMGGQSDYLRAAAVAEAYAFTDGRSAERAATWVTAMLEKM